METTGSSSSPPPAATQAAGEIPAPALDYAPPPRAARLRRWLRPGSVGFFVLVLALTIAGSWWGWKWRVAADERAFNEVADSQSHFRTVIFTKPPNAPSLRHLARLPGTWGISFRLSADPGPSAPLVLRGRRFSNVFHIEWFCSQAADPWLMEFSRPDSSLKALIVLNLCHANVTDAGLKELARPDSGLKSLTRLDLYNTGVTNAGVQALQKARPGLKIEH